MPIFNTTKRISFLTALAGIILTPGFSLAQGCPTVNAVPQPPAIFDCGATVAKLVAVVDAGPGTATTALTYSWSGPITASMSGVNTATLLANAFGVYTITVKDPTIPCTVISTMTIVPGQLTASLSAYSLPTNTQVVYFLNHSSSSLSNLNINSTWAFGNGQNSVTTVPSVTPSTTYTLPGTYTVTLFVTKGACQNTAQIQVYPGLISQAFLGLKEEQIFGEEKIRYFDLMGNEQAPEKNKLLIEQNGWHRRKVIIVD